MASPSSLTGLSTFQSTPSARRATVALAYGNFYRQISIHALREEGDQGCSSLSAGASEFQSTPSARRATHAGRPKPP